MENSDPIVWPSGTLYPNFPNHSINLLDCQGGVLDLRNLNSTRTLEYGTTVFYRCLIIYGDSNGSWISTQYFYDTTSIFPCNVCCSLHAYPRIHALCASVTVVVSRGLFHCGSLSTGLLTEFHRVLQYSTILQCVSSIQYP